KGRTIAREIDARMDIALPPKWRRPVFDLFAPIHWCYDTPTIGIGEESAAPNVPRDGTSQMLVLAAGFERFARQHRPFLENLARKLCRGRFDKDDLVQDVLERALKGYGRLHPDVDGRSWLARIMHNRFVDVVRHHQRAPRMELF